MGKIIIKGVGVTDYATTEALRATLAMGPTPGPWTAKSHAAPRADHGIADCEGDVAV